LAANRLRKGSQGGGEEGFVVNVSVRNVTGRGNRELESLAVDFTDWVALGEKGGGGH